MDRLKFIPPEHETTYEIGDEGIGLIRTVLLLEDEMEFAHMLKEYLESYHYSVTIAPDGVQGMKRVMEKDYDVVICDLLMPNLPGDMFYLGVARVKPYLTKRFIFITGHQNNPRIADFVKKVRALTLFKPFDMHVLTETIGVAIKNAAKGS